MGPPSGVPSLKLFGSGSGWESTQRPFMDTFPLRKKDEMNIGKCGRAVQGVWYFSLQLLE